jgi:hypothetical protein
MKRQIFPVVSLMFACVTSLVVSAQQNASAPHSAASSAVPNFVNYIGVLKDANGEFDTGIIGVTFLLYAEQEGGVPLWLETQNVTPDKSGHYAVQLGATSTKGLPADLFISGDARWLAVQVTGQAEQARVMLVAVPYAVKAKDAETIGGLPPSAFLLAAPAHTNTTAALNRSPSTESALSAASSDVTTTGGNVNAVPLFNTATNIQDSIIRQTGASAIEVEGKLNLPATGTAKATRGFNSQPQDFVASVFNSRNSAAVAQRFRWQAEPSANDMSNASGTMNFLYASGTATPAETGLKINSQGLLTFATGQTFPGTGNGTITGVMAGTDLTGGGSSGSVTLNLDTTKVPQLKTANTFTGNQSVMGNLTASGQVQGGPAGFLLSDGIGQTMQVFSNASPVGAASGTVQFIPNTGTLVGIEAYSVGLVSGTYGDFYCHHGLVGGGTGICYFADVANSAGHVANSFSQAVQFDSVNSSGTDVFTSVRANPQNSLEISSGGSPGASFGTIRQVPTVFANLPPCESALEGTTATLTDSAVNTWGATITGGGNNHVLAYCDGTDWTVSAK